MKIHKNNVCTIPFYCRPINKDFVVDFLSLNVHSAESSVLSCLLRWNWVSWNQCHPRRFHHSVLGYMVLRQQPAILWVDPPLPSEGESQNSFIKLTHLLSGRNQYLPCLFVKLYISTASIYWCGQPSVELSAIFLNGCLKGVVRKFSFPRHQTAAGWGIMIHQPDQNSEWFRLAFQNRNASAPDHHNEWHLSTTCLLRLGLAFLPT